MTRTKLICILLFFCVLINIKVRGVQGPASTDPPARNRPNRRSTGGSEYTPRSVTDWHLKNPNSSDRTRVSNYFTRNNRSDRIIYNKKTKKADLTCAHPSKSVMQPQISLTRSQHKYQPLISNWNFKWRVLMTQNWLNWAWNDRSPDSPQWHNNPVLING